MSEIAMAGALYGYKPHKDGGGTVTFMLDEIAYRGFIASIPDLFTMWKLARLVDETSSASEGS